MASCSRRLDLPQRLLNVLGRPPRPAEQDVAVANERLEGRTESKNVMSGSPPRAASAATGAARLGCRH
jgi:hypothetical protein